MDLKGLTIREWMGTVPPDAFPGRGRPDYWKRFLAFEDYLVKEVHPLVTVGASLADGGYLTDHGPDHITTVLLRASELARAERFSLSPYEAYLFCTAAHLHDVGNILERIGHEEKAEEVTASVDSYLGDDAVERNAIFTIARAHGGAVDGDPDTISYLPPEDFVMNATIRPRVIAALLRFADELADDRTRAAKTLLKLKKIPPSSRIYHEYAYALHSVIVRVPGDSVELRFDMTRELACQTFGKGTGEVYLIDEIFERTLKMHRERMYCMRFLRPELSIDKIGVRLSIYGPRFLGKPIELQYILKEAGYPVPLPGENIHRLCPELSDDRFGGSVNGSAVHRFIEKEK